VTQDEMRAALAGRSGTPAELAMSVGTNQQDGTFKRALASLVDIGSLEAEGNTRSRYYEPSAWGAFDAALLNAVPCTARALSDVMAGFADLDPAAMGQRKLLLGISTYRGEDDRWHCKATGKPIVLTPARETAGLTRESGYTDSEKFAAPAAKAAKGGKTIGAGKRDAGA